MAQARIRSFVREPAGRGALPDAVVEFGSLQVEDDQDGDLRPRFAGRPYVGTDFREGPGVDRVEALRALTFADERSAPRCAWTRWRTARTRRWPAAIGRETPRLVRERLRRG